MEQKIFGPAVTLTHEGPSGASLPMIMVQAASREVRRLMVTERTLMRCGCVERRSLEVIRGHYEVIKHATLVLSTPSTRARVLSEALTVVLRNPST